MQQDTIKEHVASLLLVDDDEDELSLISDALKTRSDKIVTKGAASVDEALLLIRSGFFPDLILLDINMPKKSGFDFLKAMKGDKVLGNVPVVMYSNSNRPDDISQAFKLGAKAFWTKDDSFARIKKNLDYLLDIDPSTPPPSSITLRTEESI